MADLRKKATAVLKVGVSILLLYFVFRQIPFGKVWVSLKASEWSLILAALLFFILSKGIAALRLNCYFHHIGIPLTHRSNIKLYVLGMFYNLFLPGGIGGDAYKGYLLHKHFDQSLKRIAGVLFLDRVSGLFALFSYSILLIYILDPEVLSPYRWGWPPVLAGSLGLFYLGHQRLFPFARPVFWPAFGYSALVQLAQLASAGCIVLALGVDANYLPYLLLFLLSSMAAVLPFTIGGVGSRELVFLYGSRWWGLEEPVALAVSLLFFGITALVSLSGAGFHFKNPNLEVVAADPGTRGV